MERCAIRGWQFGSVIRLGFRFAQCGLGSHNRDLIPRRDLATLDRLGINPAIAVAEIAHQRFRDIQVAEPGVGIDVGRGTADDALDDFEAHVAADREFLADEVELAKGLPALDIDIAAKAQRIDRRADHVLDRGDRGEVDDGDDFAGDVGEAVAGGVEDLRRPAQFVGAIVGEEVFNRRPAVGGAQVAARGFALAEPDAEHVGLVVERGAQAGEPLVLHQHEKMLLGEIGAPDRVEAGRSVLDGIEPVAGNGLAGRKRDAMKRLGAEAFDRVAVDGVDVRHDLSMPHFPDAAQHVGRKRSGALQTRDLREALSLRMHPGSAVHRYRAAPHPGKVPPRLFSRPLCPPYFMRWIAFKGSATGVGFP